MSGHTYTHTHIHTYTHTYTHDNYYNPRCAHAHRGLIIMLNIPTTHDSHSHTHPYTNAKNIPSYLPLCLYIIIPNSSFSHAYIPDLNWNKNLLPASLMNAEFNLKIILEINYNPGPRLIYNKQIQFLHLLFKSIYIPHS